MQRISRYALLASIVVAMLTTTGGAFGSAPIPCVGTVQLTGSSGFELRQADGQTVVEFDFTGLHEICLADGSVVTGTAAGHLVQRTSANGDLGIRFEETLSYGGGTLGYRGEASRSDGKWQSHVQTVGPGSGPLAGIRGQGTFWFTGPTTLADVIDYVYAR